MQLTRKARREDGFTLIELVITVAIVGIIVTALGGVMISYLKVSNSTQSRLNESTDQQLTSAYWQQDVSSLGLRSFDAAATGNQIQTQESARAGAAPSGIPSGCTGAVGGGTVVAGFVWNDYPIGAAASAAWDANVNGVLYVAKAVGLQWELSRTRCSTSGSTVTNVIAHRLTGAPTAACLNAAGASTSCTGTAPLPAAVTLTMTVSDKSAATSTGYTTTLTAQRRQG